jgi:alkylation response protein AidB-like acyl-CoA dehydrogenase
MTLGLTEEHLQLAEAVSAWAQRHCPADVVRAAADGPDSGSAHYLASLAPGLAEQGLLGLHVPEEDGGQGYGLPELAVAVEELGRALVPGAFLPTVFASAALAAAGLTGKLITGLADGSKTGAVGLVAGLTGTREGDGDLVIEGESGPVLGGSLADLVILPVQTDAGEVWAAIDAGSLDITALESLDLTRPVARVRAARAAVPADRLLTGLNRAAVTSLAAILFGAEASGIADWATRAASEYAKIRHQFGRPIGQFQAVKHRCARMLTEAEQAAAAVWDAARAEPGEQREFGAAVAAVVALNAAVWCAHQCIQVLGGIGYTWEHEAHLYYRRAGASAPLFGTATAHRMRLDPSNAAGTARGGQAEAITPPPPGTPAAELTAQVQRLLPLHREKWGDDDSFAARLDWQAALHAVGWIAPHWTPEFGGRGLNIVDQVACDRVLAQYRAPDLAGVLGVNNVSPTLMRYGTPEQQAHLRGIQAGTEVWCQGFSEPGSGSDLASLRTRAVLDEGTDEFVINGEKIWTSEGMEADYCMLLVRTDPDAPPHKGISALLVPMDSPGITRRPITQITGEGGFAQVFFDDVRVPRSALLGPLHQGWTVTMTTLSFERVGVIMMAGRLEQTILDVVAELAGRELDPAARARPDRRGRRARRRALGHQARVVPGDAVGGR